MTGSEGVAQWPVSPVSRSCACDSQCSRLEITRDTSVVSGGMRDLVQNAKQVRRLIREASFDSEASDLNLDFDDDIGDGTIGVDHSDCISLVKLSVTVTLCFPSRLQVIFLLLVMHPEGHDTTLFKKKI